MDFPRCAKAMTPVHALSMHVGAYMCSYIARFLLEEFCEQYL